MTPEVIRIIISDRKPSRLTLDMETKKILLSSPRGDAGRRFSLRLREKAARKEELSQQASGQEVVQPEQERSRKRSSEENTTEISAKKAKTSSLDDSLLRTAGDGSGLGDSSLEANRSLQEEAEEEDLEEEDEVTATTFNSFPDIDSPEVAEETEDQNNSPGSDLELIIYSQSTSSEMDTPVERRSARNTGYSIWDIED